MGDCRKKKCVGIEREMTLFNCQDDGVRQPDNAEFVSTWICRSVGTKERRQVAVLACRFACGGDASQALDPEDMVSLLEERRDCVASIIHQLGGRLARTDPDIQIAYWGWPSACETDMRFAVVAARRIIERLGAQVRCGVDVGIVVAGSLEESPVGFCIVGDVVAGATAMAEGAEGGAARLSPVVRDLLQQPFESSADADSDADIQEGIDTSVPSISFEGSIQQKKRGPRFSRLTARDREIAALMRALDLASTGQSSWMHVMGVAGIGKSALVEHLGAAAVAAGAGAGVVVVHCVPDEQPFALLPIRRLIQGLEYGGNGESAPAVADQKLNQMVLSLVHARVHDRALVLILEDLHWADRATVSAVEVLATSLNGTRGVLLVTTSREPVVIHTECATPRQTVEVAKLAKAEIDDMLSTSAASRTLATSRRRLIAEHADGNPRYAWELARLCTDTDDDAAHHRLLMGPNRLNAGLACRLDSLGMSKPLVQAAAVLGREFDPRVLAAMLGMGPGAVTPHLDRLAEIGVLEKRAAGDAVVYRFVEAVMWSISYGTVLRSRRRRLHETIARMLPHSFPELAKAAPDVVAYHFKKSGDQTSAFKWWRDAAFAATRQNAAEAVVNHVQEAMAAKLAAPAACPAVEEAELLGLLGARLGSLRGHAASETVATFERALALISSVSEKPADLTFDIIWGLTAVHLVRGHVHEALTASTQLLEVARKFDRRDLLLIALRMHGTARLMSGRTTEAIELLEHAASLYDKRAHATMRLRYVSDQGATALAHLASAYAIAGNAELSIQTQRRALALAGEIGHPHTSANVLGVLSFSAIHRGEPGVAGMFALAGHALASEHGYEYWAARAAMVMAWRDGLDGSERGFNRMVEAIQGYEQTGAGRASVLSQCLLAEIAIKAGLPDRAWHGLETVARHGEKNGQWVYIPEVLRLQAIAMTARRDGSGERVAALLTRAKMLAQEQGALAFAAQAKAELATRFHGAK